MIALVGESTIQLRVSALSHQIATFLQLDKGIVPKIQMISMGKTIILSFINNRNECLTSVKITIALVILLGLTAKFEPEDTYSHKEGLNQITVEANTVSKKFINLSILLSKIFIEL